MARRKYVKENNLVKAINTDSLELQKPLGNEYYDINVYNSNLDKLDLGYKRNKNEISSVHQELSKAENTKYTTKNGMKNFSCKDGYVDNIVIEGQTRILNNSNIEVEVGSEGCKLASIGQGDKIEFLTKNSGETKQDKKTILTTLRSLPNGVKDTIEKCGNKYVKIQRCEEIVIDAHSNFIIGIVSNHNTVWAKIVMPDNFKATRDNLYCDRFPALDSIEFDREYILSEALQHLGKHIYVCINQSRLQTVDEEGFRTWLRANPITVVYELETHILVELPNFNPQTYEGDTTLLINSGVVQADAGFEITNSIGSEIDVLKDKVSSIDTLPQNILNINKRLDWFEPIYVNNPYELANLPTGTYKVTGGTGFPHGWGYIEWYRWTNEQKQGIIKFIHINLKYECIAFLNDSLELSSWDIYSTRSLSEVLECQEQEAKILALQEENEKLKIEQERQNEEILVNMLANTEMFEMILGMIPMTLSEEDKTKNSGGNSIIEVYCMLIIKGIKAIEDIPLVIREQVVGRLKQLEIPVK